MVWDLDITYRENMDDKHMKRYLMSLAAGEMQIKIITHLLQWLKFKKQKTLIIPSAGENVNRIQNGTAMFLVKLNIHLSFDPAILFLDNILSELKTYVHI